MTFVGTNANGEKYIEMTIHDLDSGLSNITVLQDVNATVTGHIAGTDFTVGTTADVIVTGTKINQAESAVVELQITDLAGKITVCYPVITVEHRTVGQPVTNTHYNIPEAESNVTIKNGPSGIQSMEVNVNGDKYQVAGLQHNEQITISVAGKPLGSATVVISD